MLVKSLGIFRAANLIGKLREALEARAGQESVAVEILEL